MSKSKRFYDEDLLWTQEGNKSANLDISAQAYWKELPNKSEDAQEKWLKDWINNEAETLSAPKSSN